MINNVAVGNLLLSAAILFSGSLPSKAIRMLQHINIATITTRTYDRHQKSFLHSAVNKLWEEWQAAYIKEIKKEKYQLVIGGDGRADSPGYSG